MTQSIYENHNHPDPHFPIIFHQDTFTDEAHDCFFMHYHEHLELLYIIEGTGLVTYDTTSFPIKPHDLVIINSNVLHSIQITSPILDYYCLILDKSFCESLDIPIEKVSFHHLLEDDILTSHILAIAKEMTTESTYYKPMVKASATQILIELCRNYTLSTTDLIASSSHPRLLIVKQSINYIKAHFLSELSIDEICHQVGFSKYYLCHVFKEITGHTLLDYINFLRCEHARKLIYSGYYNVSEAALQSGFNNLSYFSKTYHKHMGVLPSKDLQNS